ncbi:unnamed protein product, partial [Iphiclides podalirius]
MSSEPLSIGFKSLKNPPKAPQTIPRQRKLQNFNKRLNLPGTECGSAKAPSAKQHWSIPDNNSRLKTYQLTAANPDRRGRARGDVPYLLMLIDLLPPRGYDKTSASHKARLIYLRARREGCATLFYCAADISFALIVSS